MREQATDLLRICVSPTVTFTNLRQKPSWFLAYTLCSITLFANSLHAPSLVLVTGDVALVPIINSFLISILLFVSTLLPLAFIGTATLLFCGISLANSAFPNARLVASTTSYSLIPCMVLLPTINTIVAVAGNNPAYQSDFTLRFLFPHADPIIKLALSGVNPFILWSALLMVGGLVHTGQILPRASVWAYVPALGTATVLSYLTAP